MVIIYQLDFQNMKTYLLHSARYVKWVWMILSLNCLLMIQIFQY